MSRGSSIVAGLVLVGTLSALAVVLDNSGAVMRVADSGSSQQAAAGLAAETTKPAPTTKTTAKTEPAEAVRKCEPAFDYEVSFDNKKKEPSVKCNPAPKRSSSDGTVICPGTSAGCSNKEEVDTYLKGKEDYPTHLAKARQGCNGKSACLDNIAKLELEWVKVCTQSGLTYKFCGSEDAKSCVTDSKDTCKLSDQSVVSKAKSGAAKKFPSLLKNAKDPKELEALKSTQGLLKTDDTSSRILLDGLNAGRDEISREIANERDQIARLRQLAETDPENAAATMREIEAREARIKELEAQRARLASAAKELESKDGPPGTKEKEKGNPYAQSGYGPGDTRGGQMPPGNNTFPKTPMMPSGGQGNKGGQGQQQTPQQCYNNNMYAGQNNAYCSNGSIYVYNNQTCQHQVAQQCPSGQCNTQQLTNDMYGRQISTSCAPTTPTNTQITAQLTCTPKRADLGSSVSIQYSCSQGTATGNGFTASGQSGSATVTPEKPQRGTTSVTYGLTCTGPQGQTAQATPCQVEVSVPLIVVVAAPQEVERGKYSTLGWVTRGMKSCVIQSTDDSHSAWNNEQKKVTSVSGTVKSPDLTEDTVFELICKTQEDKEKKSNVTVRVK